MSGWSCCFCSCPAALTFATTAWSPAWGAAPSGAAPSFVAAAAAPAAWPAVAVPFSSAGPSRSAEPGTGGVAGPSLVARAPASAGGGLLGFLTRGWRRGPAASGVLPGAAGGPAAASFLDGAEGGPPGSKAGSAFVGLGWGFGLAGAAIAGPAASIVDGTGVSTSRASGAPLRCG